MLKTVLNNKCPACHKGDLFLSSNPYEFKKMGDMHKRCPNCDVNLVPEPGFYFGAAYVSYALGVAWWVALYVGIYLFITISIELFLIIGVVSLLLVTPIIYRLSRSIWASFFIRKKRTASDSEE